MRSSCRAAALLCAGFLLAGPARCFTLTFDELSPGATLGSQYAALGVTFTANAFSGPGSSSSGLPWATNTDMTVVSIVSGTLGVDYGALGSPTLVANNILQSFSNWQYLENGDPSFWIDFAMPVSTVSVTFAGIGGAAAAPDTRLFAYAGTTLLGRVAASLPDSQVGQRKLTVAFAGITRVAVVPGSFDDWVGIDLIDVTPAVPEPAAWVLGTMGLAGLAASAARRRRRDA